MQENFINNWQLLTLYAPVGLIGLWRWSVFIFRKILASNYKVKKGNYNASLSIVTPVYNEDPKMFRRALKSWIKNHPNEIIAVIDYTDKACIKVFRNLEKKYKQAWQKRNRFNKSKKRKFLPKIKFVLYITKRPGKREALEDGVRIAKGKFVALIDSDTIWGKKIKTKLLAPFRDPKVGGVAPRQDVLKPDTLARKLFKIHLFNRFNNELTFLAATDDALTCISGRTGVYRSKAIKSLMQEMVSETFLGKKCISGDDKCLSHLVLENGWKQKYLAHVLVYTPGSEKIRDYSKQLVRWTRNSWRSDLKAVFNGWVFKHKYLAFHLLDRFISPFTLLLGPIFFIYSLVNGHNILALLIVVWWLVSRSLKIAGHLIENPKDVALIPIYILFTFFMGVIKIYTLLTVGRQSWVTRWDKSRLLKLDFLKMIVPPIMTALIIFLMSFAVFKINSINSAILQADNQNQAFQNQLVVEKLKYREENQVQYISNEELSTAKSKIFEENRSDPYGYYQVQKGDTLDSIMQKFGIEKADLLLDQDKRNLSEFSLVKREEKVVFPLAEMRKPFDLEKLNSNLTNRAVLTYDRLNNVITITGKGSLVTIPQIYTNLNNNQALEKLPNNEWLLKASLDIKDDVVLVIDGKEVSWLKLKSDQDYAVYIKSENASVLINNTKITSWDLYNNSFDENIENDRSYILQKNSGRMDILNSELAYLGNLGIPDRGAPFGGPYGISWKIEDNALYRHLVTGVVKNNKIHHNLFGLYTYGATGIIFSENEVYENIQYGIDPHDDSNNLLIENNYVHHNGTHGIITSKRCYNNLIQNNVSVNNKLHGIMLDRNSNYNIVRDNLLTGNTDGIAIYDSHANLIINNQIKDNEKGIRNNQYSSANIYENNLIENHQKGIYFYESASDNLVGMNTMENNELNYDLKEGVTNQFIKNLKTKQSNEEE
jgi:hyaluronan synthase